MRTRCPDCRRAVHRFCGTPYGKDEEGFGQRIWCSKSEQCQLKVPADATSKRPLTLPLTRKGKLSPSKRARIWEMHQQNPKLPQAKLAAKAREEFKLDSLTQATVSTVLKEFKVSAVKAGNLTVGQCHQIREKSKQNPRMTQKELAEWAQKEFRTAKLLTQPAISNILNNKRQLLDEVVDSNLNLKRPRVVKLSALDEALASWVISCQERGICLSWQILRKKAEMFADEMQIEETDRPAFSDGWLQKFLHRRNFKTIHMSGESRSADVEAIRSELPALQQIIAQYQPSDVFNMDETGLFYCMAPDRTIASRQIGGIKKDKTRITIALCANSNGTEKRNLFFIGHAEKPRAFKKKRGEDYGFYYRWNRKAWMTTILFQEWLLKFDIDMRKQQRQVLLLLDNAPSHAVKTLNLTNVTVMFFPPNTTSHIQPMDAGIISTFKKRYRSFQLGMALDREKNGLANIYKIDILQAMIWCRDSWKMTTSETIKNCWSHTGLLEAVNVDSSVEVEELGTGIMEEDLDEGLNEIVGQLTCDPLELNKYLTYDDDIDVHQQFRDEDILATYADESDSGDDDDVTEISEQPRTISLDEKINALQVSIEILNENSFDNLNEIKKLRRLLYGFCNERSELRLANLKQSDIRSYFK
jgi:arginine repressor